MTEQDFAALTTPASEQAPPRKSARTAKANETKGKKRIKRASKQEVADSIRSLAMMLEVQRGEILPVRTLADQYEGTRLGSAYRRVEQDLLNGVPFATAFENEETFPAVSRRMARVGARTGAPGPHLRKSADLIDDTLDTSAKVRSALLEPTILGIVIVVFFFAMVAWAVPQLVEVFASTGQELPALSKIALKISTVARIATPLIAVLGASIWVWWRKAGRKAEKFRIKLDRFLLKLPLLGRLRRDAAIANTTSVLQALTSLGISEREALITAADSSDNYAFQAHIHAHAEALTAGEVKFQDIADGQLIPLAVGNVLAAAASSGKLDVGLDHIADTYRRSARVKADNLSTALGPVANIAVGALFFAVVLIIYLPMYSMFTAITSF